MKNNILVLPLALLFFACESPIDVDVANQDDIRLVVEGAVLYYEDDPENGYQEVRLSESESFFGSPTADIAVKNAQVSITDNNTNLIYSLTESLVEPGLYTTNSLKAKVGHNYTLRISAEIDGEMQSFETSHVTQSLLFS